MTISLKIKKVDFYSIINYKLKFFFVIVILIFLNTGCSSNNSFEECQKMKAIDEYYSFETILGQKEYKNRIITNYVNFKDKKLKEIIKIMLIENDLEATTVNSAIAVYCQQIGYKYYN